VEWQFNLISLAVVSPVELNIYYANGTNANRPMSISVNGVVVEPNLAFEPTASWDVWEKKTLLISLAAGNNIIRATSANPNGGPNVDRIELKGNLLSSSSSSVSSSNVSSSSSNNPGSVPSSNSSSVASSSSSVSSSASSSSSSSSQAAQEVRAFPGAEGFAAMVTGGRGGRVIKVTNLNATGPGSLRDALSQSGKRIIVFDVSGTIRLPSQGGKYGGILWIENGDVTIAGQTAPGAGITIEGRLYMSGISNVIVRHLRVRPEYDGSANNQFDAIQIYRSQRIMLDHVSASFGVDETIDAYEANDITLQWSTVESAYRDAEGHNYGFLNGEPGRRVSVLNNIFAHNSRRNPAISNGPADVINNVIYNVRHGFHHDDPAANNNNAGQFNVAGNYFKAGPSSATLIPIWFWKEIGDIPSSYYAQGNWTDTSAGNSQCPQGNMTNPRCNNDENNQYRNFTLVETPFNFTAQASGWRMPNIKTAAQAYAQVLARAGAFPRDLVTRRTVSEIQAGTGAWNSRRDGLDMMDGLTPSPALDDSDKDGMPDLWEAERAHLGLSPHVADHNTIMPSGYTAIEEYINEQAAAILP
jgi:pectate lyase